MRASIATVKKAIKELRRFEFKAPSGRIFDITSVRATNGVWILSESFRASGPEIREMITQQAAKAIENKDEILAARERNHKAMLRLLNCLDSIR